MSGMERYLLLEQLAGFATARVRAARDDERNVVDETQATFFLAEARTRPKVWRETPMPELASDWESPSRSARRSASSSSNLRLTRSAEAEASLRA